MSSLIGRVGDDWSVGQEVLPSALGERFAVVHGAGQGNRYPPQAAGGVCRDLDVQASTVPLAGVVVVMTSAVAGRDVGAVDQDNAATNGLLEIGNVKAESFSDEGQDAAVDSGNSWLAEFEQVADGSLVQILSDVHEGEYDRAVQSHDRRPQLPLAALGDLPDARDELLNLVSGKPCSRLVAQRFRL